MLELYPTPAESISSRCSISIYSILLPKMKILSVVLVCCLVAVQCGPVNDENNEIEARTLIPSLGMAYPECNETTPCADPNQFCGAKLEVLTSWFLGYRCYPKKTAGWLCNSGNVCVSGTCNMIAFNLGYCSA